MGTPANKKPASAKPAQAVKTPDVDETEETVQPAAPAFDAAALQAMINEAVASALAAQKEKSDREIAELKEKLAEKEKSVPSYSIPSTDVTLVYMADFPAVLNKVPGISLQCHKCGEKFTLSRSQFDAIVGQYYNWFENGMLAVSHKNIDVAAEKGLRTDDEFAISAKKLAKLGTMPVSEIETLWNSCTTDAERLSIVSYYKRKFIEGKEPGFHETARVLMMNTLTNQGLRREAIEISGASLKISPTDLMD